MSVKNASKTAAQNNVATPNSTAKQEKTAVKQDKQVTYIKEGLTGKMLQSSKSVQNQSAKKQLKTISSCLTAIKASEGEFLQSFVNFNVKDLTPPNLLPLRTEKEFQHTEEKGFSTWIVLGLIKRFYEAKK